MSNLFPRNFTKNSISILGTLVLTFVATLGFASSSDVNKSTSGERRHGTMAPPPMPNTADQCGLLLADARQRPTRPLPPDLPQAPFVAKLPESLSPFSNGALMSLFSFDLLTEVQSVRDNPEIEFDLAKFVVRISLEQTETFEQDLEWIFGKIALPTEFQSDFRSAGFRYGAILGGPWSINVQLTGHLLFDIFEAWTLSPRRIPLRLDRAKELAPREDQYDEERWIFRFAFLYQLAQVQSENFLSAHPDLSPDDVYVDWVLPFRDRPERHDGDAPIKPRSAIISNTLTSFVALWRRQMRGSGTYDLSGSLNPSLVVLNAETVLIRSPISRLRSVYGAIFRGGNHQSEGYLGAFVAGQMALVQSEKMRIFVHLKDQSPLPPLGRSWHLYRQLSVYLKMPFSETFPSEEDFVTRTQASVKTLLHQEPSSADPGPLSQTLLDLLLIALDRHYHDPAIRQWFARHGMNNETDTFFVRDALSDALRARTERSQYPRNPQEPKDALEDLITVLSPYFDFTGNGSAHFSNMNEWLQWSDLVVTLLAVLQ